MSAAKQPRAKRSRVAVTEVPTLFASSAHEHGVFDANHDPCCVCGRPVKSGDFWVEVHEGGRPARAGEAVKDAGYMGFFRVGSECRKRFPFGYVVMQKEEEIAR